MTPISFVKNNNNYIVNGDLTFATIDPSTLNAVTFNQKNIIVDFKSVTMADSAGLALLVEWYKKAKSKNINLHFNNLPEQIKTLARLVEVNDLIKNTL